MEKYTVSKGSLFKKSSYQARFSIVKSSARLAKEEARGQHYQLDIYSVGYENLATGIQIKNHEYIQIFSKELPFKTGEKSIKNEKKTSKIEKKYCTVCLKCTASEIDIILIE